MTRLLFAPIAIALAACGAQPAPAPAPAAPAGPSYGEVAAQVLGCDYAVGDVPAEVAKYTTAEVLARFDSPAEAEACNAALKAEGIIVRPVAGYGLPECLRITIGDEAA